jgi:hypothetical protein
MKLLTAVLSKLQNILQRSFFVRLEEYRNHENTVTDLFSFARFLF